MNVKLLDKNSNWREKASNKRGWRIGCEILRWDGPYRNLETGKEKVGNT